MFFTFHNIVYMFQKLWHWFDSRQLLQWKKW